MNLNKRDIEFLFEIGSMRNMSRGWKQHLAMDCASNTEHSFRVAFIALMLARAESVNDEEKILKMALIHDLAESRTSDVGYIQKVYVETDEEKATQDLFKNTGLENLLEILKEYESRKTPEAKIVKDADNLDIDLELKEIEERGSKFPRKVQKFRSQIRNEKLYTKSAKSLWDLLQTVDVSDWHLVANKWVKIPDAGK